LLLGGYNSLLHHVERVFPASEKNDFDPLYAIVDEIHNAGLQVDATTIQYLRQAMGTPEYEG
jgi:hypothetical protein